MATVRGHDRDTGATIGRHRHAEELAVRYLHDVIASAHPGGDGPVGEPAPGPAGSAPQGPARSGSGRQSRHRGGIDPPEHG
ncbi:hypothetical protein [Streptomyces laculatispora]|uniref:hypothetical protein n=1 Tax=Streptomyces laculatispora TaxID=887464 RepID=UPI001A944CD2|nr:hypothetical protein [Streptomyces laculatispora]MBO0915850.1 hypothetical protein [Streptomyces laculatispora]